MSHGLDLRSHCSRLGRSASFASVARTRPAQGWVRSRDIAHLIFRTSLSPEGSRSVIAAPFPRRGGVIAPCGARVPLPGAQGRRRHNPYLTVCTARVCAHRSAFRTLSELRDAPVRTTPT